MICPKQEQKLVFHHVTAAVVRSVGVGAVKVKTSVSGMAAARRNGMAACGKHPTDKSKTEQRKQIRKKQKGRRYRCNRKSRKNPPSWL